MASTDNIPHVEVSDFKIENFKIQKTSFPDKDGKIKGKAFTGNQVISYVNYDYETDSSQPTGCYFLTDFIKLSYGGVPGDKDKDGKAVPEEQRRFVKVPLDPEQKHAQQLKSVLSSMDEYVEQEKTAIFGSYADNYVDYQQLVKLPKPKEGEEIDPETAKSFCKFKFDQTSIPVVYVVKEKKDGQVTRVSRVKCDDINDFAKYVRYGNTVKFLCQVSKLWCDHPKNSTKLTQKGKKTETTPIGKYGLTIKVKQVLVEERQANTSSKNVLREKFLLGGNISVDEETVSSSASATAVKTQVRDDSDEESGEEEEDSDED
jgi:hypothetical protein